MSNGTLVMVVTGATGFVGSALVRACVENPNVEIHALVRVKGRLPEHPRIREIEGDLDTIDKGLFPDQPHVLVHLATKNLDPDGTGYTATNVQGTNKLLQSCSSHTAGIIYNSSLSVLGQSAQVNCPNTISTHPQTKLAVSRAKAEKIVLEYGKQNQRVVYCLRPRFVLGQGDQFVMPALAKLARSGVYVGSGSQRFSIVDVDDYAQVILQLSQRCLNWGKAEQLPLNVGYKRPVKFSEIFETIREYIAQPSSKKVIPAPSILAAILSRLPSTTLNAKATQLQLIGLDHFSDVSDTESRLSSNILSRNSLEYLSALASQY